MRSSAAGALWMLALALGASSAAGSEERPTAELDYRQRVTQLGCPTEAELRAAIAARLGYDPFQKPPDVLVRATLETKDGRLVATVVASEPSGAPLGERTLDSASDCAELGRALALAVSVAIDPLVLSRPAPAEPEPASPPVTPPPAAPAPASERPATAAPPAPPTATPAWVPGALLAGGVSAGVTPRVTPVFDVGLTLRRDWWSARLLARVDTAQDAAGPSGGTLSVDRFGARLLMCATSSFYLLGCAGFSAGMVRAEGEGLDETKSARELLLAPLAAVGGELRLSKHFAVELQAGADFALRRLRFELNYENAHTTSTLSPWTTLALIGELP